MKGAVYNFIFHFFKLQIRKLKLCIGNDCQQCGCLSYLFMLIYTYLSFKVMCLLLYLRFGQSKNCLAAHQSILGLSQNYSQK